MRYFKAFVAGTVVPTIAIPIVLLTAVKSGRGDILQVPFVHMLPVVWGLWNVIYFALLKKFLPKSEDLSLAIAGALLGLLVASWAVFGLKLPTLLHVESLKWIPLIVGPALYALLWRFLVKYLNRMFV